MPRLQSRELSPPPTGRRPRRSGRRPADSGRRRRRAMMPDMGGLDNGGRPDLEARSGPVTSVDTSGKPEPIRVLVADDHVLFRRGLEMVLQAEEGIEVVGEA